MSQALKILLIAIYIRVSTKAQADEGYSLDGQLEACKDRIKQEYGDDVQFQVYVDGGESGKSTNKRTALKQMLRDVKAGKIHAVLTWKVSRLARNMTDSLLIVKEIDESGVEFVSLKEGKYGSPHDKLRFNILSAVAEYQREELAENVQLGMTQRSREGYWNGGRVLGYESVDKMLKIVPQEAAIVRLIFEKCVHERWGGKRLTNYLNTCGYRTKSGKPFKVDGVHRILRNPIYKGYVRFNQVVNWDKLRRKGTNKEPDITKGHHEPIVAEELWDEAQRILDSRATGVPRQYSGTFPLTGLTKCPECGSYMTSMYGGKRKDGSKRRYYVCGGYHNSGRAVCRPNYVPAERLEEAVWERLVKAMTTDEILQELAQRVNTQIIRHNDYEPDGSQQLMRRLEALEEQKRRIHEGFEAGIYTAAESTEKLKPIRESIAKIEQELASNGVTTDQKKTSLRPVTPAQLGRQLQEFFELKKHLDVGEVRQLLQASITKIEVHNKSLKRVHFSFVMGEESSEPDSSDPEDPVHNPVEHLLLYRTIFLPQKRHLSMIRFPPHNPDPAI
ncbi:cassette chromosome recombinase B [Alicyclobacillus hesperidum]|uniref:Cassette chromosome recombinase B n=1 Tax=Alicyclobacillus hesperidum TaxID=89784 RepID=A0A1H2X543_9BACL|nr:recombinase family protein [Alicyclobacillus hesperidum]GLV14752.1 cassette chromosome recombinase B [Alicyclobacillus hesperidum]SDW87866.1 site-specific DNA recombinase [Alicyclobacillus hesperidum]